MTTSAPAGWSQSTIGELVKFKRGFTWNKAQERDAPGPGLVPVLRIPNVQSQLDLNDLLFLDGVSTDDRAKYRAARGYSLLVGSNGNAQRIGNCVLIEDHMDFVFASFLIAAASANSSNLTPEYLYRLLASEPIQGAISDSVQGSTGLKNISLTLLRSLTIAVPPLAEQRRIAATLSAVDAVIEKAEAVIKSLQALKKAMMQELLTRGLPGRHTRFKQTEVGEIPEDWSIRRLSECATVQDPNPSHRYPPEDVAGIPLVSTANFVGDDFYDLASAPRVPQSTFEEQNSRCSFVFDDVVFARKGRIGFARSYGHQHKVFSHTVVTIKAARERLTPAFLLWLMRAPVVLSQLDRTMNTNSGVPTLGLKTIASTFMPVPHLDEQEAIAEALGAISARSEAERQAHASLRTLKGTLMSVLLTGELRVTPNEGAA